MTTSQEKAKDHAHQVLREYDTERPRSDNAKPGRDRAGKHGPSNPQVGGRGGGIYDEDFDNIDDEELVEDTFYEDEETEYVRQGTGGGESQHLLRVLGGYKATLRSEWLVFVI